MWKVHKKCIDFIHLCKSRYIQCFSKSNYFCWDLYQEGHRELNDKSYHKILSTQRDKGPNASAVDTTIELEEDEKEDRPE